MKEKQSRLQTEEHAALNTSHNIMEEREESCKNNVRSARVEGRTEESTKQYNLKSNI